MYFINWVKIFYSVIFICCHSDKWCLYFNSHVTDLLWSKWRGRSSINWINNAVGSRSRRGTSFSYGFRAKGARGCDCIPATCCNVCQTGQLLSIRPWTANTCRRGTVTRCMDTNTTLISILCTNGTGVLLAKRRVAMYPGKSTSFKEYEASLLYHNTLSHINPTHTLTPYFVKIQLIIILWMTVPYTKFSLPIKFWQ